MTSRTLRGVGKIAWNTRGFIAPNPRKVRGVHALRGNDAQLYVYYYLQVRRVDLHAVDVWCSGNCEIQKY